MSPRKRGRWEAEGLCGTAKSICASREITGRKFGKISVGQLEGAAPVHRRDRRV